ncbi:MAG: 3-phosphoserine/phosphohydroxythreonine transaminase [Clostridiales bacterium]|nr:3-phosphoserine/phosphohydroxythreonine transaminase [Clostridiales bacterium]
MKRVFNFSAGPSTLPLEVLNEVQKDLVCYKDTGMSVMEMSHRSKMFDDIIEGAKASLKSLMNIPDDYTILFLQGGASTQFAMTALNLMQGKTAYYVNTGVFAGKALTEAKRLGDAKEFASSKSVNFSHIPKVDTSLLPTDAAYLHITTNNTIVGTQYNEIPDTNNVPLVADMSSNIIGKDYDTSKFSLIYAGAQKNIAPAGLTVVIINNDLLGSAAQGTPAMLDYKIHADKDSMYNTPPCWPIYISSLVFKWVEAQGGVAAIEKKNIKKANLVYDAINSFDLYKGVADVGSRSIMNVTFTLPNDELTNQFVQDAAAIDLVNVRGHRSVGGIRTCLYNAMPYEGVQRLANFMADFAKKNG